MSFTAKVKRTHTQRFRTFPVHMWVSGLEKDKGHFTAVKRQAVKLLFLRN